MVRRVRGQKIRRSMGVRSARRTRSEQAAAVGTERGHRLREKQRALVRSDLRISRRIGDQRAAVSGQTFVECSHPRES